MPKGFYSQGVCILLSEPVSLDTIEQALHEFDIAGRQAGGEDELVDAPSILLSFRPEVDGNVLVSLIDSPWPDDMGDPQDQPEVFVAWSLGQYGPLAYPGCLQRASEQAWGWADDRETSIEHQCFIRVLCSYVIGVDDEEAPLLPPGYDAMSEMEYLTRVASALLRLPEAVCYFNPGGEVLRDEDGLREGLNYAWSHRLPALDMWTNVRLFRATEEWSLMDTVGNGQFDLPDVEAAFLADRYEPSEVEGFLRNASLYMLKEGDIIEEGDTADGAGETVWKAVICDDALTDPPRPTIRWFPDDGSEAPEELTDTGMSDEEIEQELDEMADFEDLDDDEASF